MFGGIGSRHGDKPGATFRRDCEVKAAGVNVNLCISDRATLCLPIHAIEDTLEEERLGDGAYGSTRQGIAPAYGDRVMKKGILVGWLKQPEVLRERIQFMLDWKLPQLKALYPSFEFSQTAEEMTAWLLEVSAPWRDAICNVSEPLKALQAKDETCCLKPSWARVVTWFTVNTLGPLLPT